MPNALKFALRSTLLGVRRQLSQTYIDKSSRQVYAHLKSLTPYRRAKHIALYHAVRGEIHLAELWRAAPMQGKFCYFPCIEEDNTLSFRPATPRTPFAANRFGIPEPQSSLNEALSPDALDLILMPLVAFDRFGHRLGMGAGYYDRTLHTRRHGLLVGIAYEFQKQDFLAPDAWDIPLDVIVTNKTVYWSEPCPTTGS